MYGKDSQRLGPVYVYVFGFTYIAVLLLLVMVQPEQDIRKTKATTHHKCEVI
jgi:hypothetical protein